MHTRAALLAFAISVLPAPSALAAERGIMAEFTSTLLVLVPVHVNGRGPYFFAVDTGATTTTLDDGLAIELGVLGTGAMEIVTSGGTFTAPTGVLDELRIGSIKIRSSRVVWMPLDELRRDDRRIAGVIGQDVLGRRTLAIDYDRGLVELTSSSCPMGDTTLAVTWVQGRPMIPVSLRSPGLPPTAGVVLDSAANALILFAPRRAGAETTSVSTHREAVSADVVPRVVVDIGGLRRVGPAVVIPSTAMRQETGLLPTAWFTRVCIDGPRSRATLSRLTTTLRPWL